jgi:transcriptional regulator with XRE-family HTH domain
MTTVLGLLMRRDGVTSVSLARELRCARRTVSRWINGRATPQPVYVRELERIFRAPIAELLAPIIIQETNHA